MVHGRRVPIRRVVRPSTRRGRQRRGPALIGGLCVAGLVATSALPAFAKDAQEGTAPPAPSGLSTGQRLTVSDDVLLSPVTDSWGSAKAAAGWVAPVPGELRDAFGPRFARPVAGVSGMHRGQDLGAACGRSVRAATTGTVVQAGWFGTYGNWVLIDHGGGITTGYAHNSALKVQVGERVSTGQVIALAGTTGASTGCHVHLEARTDSVPVDPVTFLARRGVRLG